jgi:predicted dehydrogenase
VDGLQSDSSIIGCGWISSEFVKDISQLRDDVTDVSHAVVAVGSRDKAKAQKFIEVDNIASQLTAGMVS